MKAKSLQILLTLLVSKLINWSWLITEREYQIFRSENLLPNYKMILILFLNVFKSNKCGFIFSTLCIKMSK